MGYTHYFRTPKTLGKRAFKAFAKDCKQIVGFADFEMGLELAGPMGDGDPEITDEVVSLNGLGEDSHEAFHISREKEVEDWETPKNGLYFNFCKTAQKPYDPIVVAILIALKKHFPKVIISSDGSKKDWEEGLEICKKLFVGDLDLEFKPISIEGSKIGSLVLV